MFVQIPYMQSARAVSCTDQGPEQADPTSVPDANHWGDPATLQDHFDRHGPDFDSSTKEQYAQQAHELYVERFSDPNVKVRRDSLGTTRMWEPSTNMFGAYNGDGSTRTFYRPDPAKHGCQSNEAYWASQPGTDPRMADTDTDCSY
jgi:pyocin large subunit-like protein